MTNRVYSWDGEGQPPLEGSGLLSGSFPLALVTQGVNLPIQAGIRILYRPEQGASGDGVVVGTTTCNADGSWQVSGLNTNLKFDIVARIPGFNDVIISDVQPTGAPLSAHFANLESEYDGRVAISIQVVGLGGTPPYSFDAITLPAGFTVNTTTGYITGIFTEAGEQMFSVKVIDAKGVEVIVSGTSVPLSDPHWDKVVSLLHFDGDLEDETGRVWINSGVTTDNTNPLYNDYGVFSGSSRMTATIPALGTNDFTIEVWVNRDADTDYRCIFDSRASNSRNGLAIYISSPLTGNVPVVWEAAQIIGGSSGIPASEWVHIALVRESGILYYYANGSLVGSGSFTSDLTNTTAIISSTYQNIQFYRGHMDEFRITKDVARYTENFIPPTKPFPNF